MHSQVMGLSELASYVSWWLYYIPVATLGAVVTWAVVTALGFLPSSQTVILLIHLVLFGISAISLAFAVAAPFRKARHARATATCYRHVHMHMHMRVRSCVRAHQHAHMRTCAHAHMRMHKRPLHAPAALVIVTQAGNAFLFSLLLGVGMFGAFVPLAINNFESLPLAYALSLICTFAGPTGVFQFFRRESCGHV